MKIFTLLRNDHRAISGLFRKLHVTTERSHVTRSRIFARLRMELSLHSDAEEKVLYSRLRQMERTQSLALQSEEAHAVIDHLISQLDRTAPSEPRWKILCDMLEENVRAHVKEEEGKMFAKMEKVFTPTELTELCGEFGDAKAGALSPLKHLVGW